MKVLWLYQYFPLYNFDHYLHMSYARFFGSYPGVELWAYGPGIQEGYSDMSLIKYDARHTLADLHKMFEFDVVIVNTKSRCFSFYSPRLKRAEGCWLPSDFPSWTHTPKVMIEEDYHYEIGDEWYAEMKFDVILQRHYSQSLRQETVPMQFLPFSVDMSTFNQWSTTVVHKDKTLHLTPQNQRQWKFAFVGNDADAAYIYRRTATTKLCDAKLGVTYTGSKKVDGEYIQVLREYAGYTACGSTYEICAGKNFEVMASGGVLFTNKFLGIDLLMPPNCYLSYKNDASDVVEQGRKLLNDPAFAKELVDNGTAWIMEHHTHKTRTKELLAILGGLR